ncbi:hypothetical protein AS189_03985 [Arthrobacter alpinus]|uniref:DUF4230 domain-containing protein n=1 Tax=Arthrobacter alpinus TaxID=656366 RepID=A0A0S2LWF2_9MICC|nr:DUF4230 domain-containing protein [Arthrobacter alpinus]ALO65804.1 hypothetical protein AS189_03985 [Arthrobacter alpinus]
MTAARMAKRITAWAVGVIIVAMAGPFIASQLGFSLFPTKQSETTLLISIQDTSKYVAAVGDFEVVVNDKEDNLVLPDILAGRQTLFVGAGTVNAYVDLSGLAEDDLTLSPDGKSVTVRLPKAQLEKPNLVQERSKVVSQDRGVLDRINDALALPEQAKFYKMAEDKIAAAAKESELRERATTNTKAMLTGMFGSMDIQATFRD